MLSMTQQRMGESSAQSPHKYLVLAMPNSTSTALARGLVYVTGKNGAHEPLSDAERSSGVYQIFKNYKDKQNLDKALYELPVLKEMISPDNPYKQKDVSEHLGKLTTLVKNTNMPIVILTASPVSMIISMISRSIGATVESLRNSDRKFLKYHGLVQENLKHLTNEMRTRFALLQNVKTIIKENQKTYISVHQNDLRINPVRTVNKIATAWGYKPVENNVAPLAPVKYVSSVKDLNADTDTPHYYVMTAPEPLIYKTSSGEDIIIYNKGDSIDKWLKPDNLKQNTLERRGVPTDEDLINKLYTIISEQDIGIIITPEQKNALHKTAEDFVEQCMVAENTGKFSGFVQQFTDAEIPQPS